MQGSVFISYSSRDKDIAFDICSALEGEGISCWIAPRDVVPGAIYAEQIVEALRSCAALVLVCSKNTESSVHVRNEVDRAFSFHRPIIPCRIEKVELGAALEYYLGSAHWLDAWDLSLEESAARLVEAIHRIATDTARSEGFETSPQEIPRSMVETQTRKSNLPVQPTPLIGREDDAEAATGLLREKRARLLTLTGPGGTGKTRLALEVAERLIPEFDDGVYFVSLGPVRDPDLVASAIAQVLGVHVYGTMPVFEGLMNHLKHRKILLVLDNFEQVIEAAGSISRLLSACPDLKVMVTSREALQLHGEYDYVVAPLGIPETAQAGADLESISQYGAVRLFIERAAAIKPSFRVTNENAPSIAEICHRLDGLPLAIELAVARIQALTPEAILARLGKRLPLLTKGARDSPVRQRTLENTIAWSYDLLGEDEKRLFRRVSIFAGGFTLDAAEHVCGTDREGLGILDGIASLVNKSLLKERDHRGEPRFRMLETVREYALGLLGANGEMEELEQRHACYYLDFVEKEEEKFYGREQLLWFERLLGELNNIRAAVRWFKTTENFRAVGSIVVATFWCWHFSGNLREIASWIPHSPQELATTSGISAGARLKMLSFVSGIHLFLNNHELSDAYSLHALPLMDTVDDAKAKILAIHFIGSAMTLKGDNETARAYFYEALSLSRRIQFKWGIAVMLRCIGWIELNKHNYESAIHFLEESLPVARAIDAPKEIVFALRYWVNAAICLGKHEKTIAVCVEGLELCRRIGDTWTTAWFLEDLAWIAAHIRNRPEQAARYLGASSAIRANLGFAMVFPAAREIMEEAIRKTRDLVQRDTFEAAWSEGRRMPVNEAVSLALEEAGRY